MFARIAAGIVGAACAACILQAFAPERAARAEPSAWMTGGGGYSFQYGQERGALDRAAAVTFSIGVGTSPLSKLVVGGLFRSTTHLTLGTDLDLSLRLAQGSFARGQWGLAFDIGPGLRAWEQATNYGHWPLHAMVIGGAPWGLQLGVGADFLSLDGGNSARGFEALLEVDILRLTLYRQGATDKWWENPAPGGGRLPRDTAER